VKPFPWDAAMGFGIGVLGLGPKEFWGLTPRELAAAFEARSGRRTRPADRTTLKRLMEQFPDE
jgi:uncharacterized phage protein (TIGR02216 family)